MKNKFYSIEDKYQVSSDLQYELSIQSASKIKQLNHKWKIITLSFRRVISEIVNQSNTEITLKRHVNWF
jgi:hypothetical protein